jgi:hypothetical protein
LFSDAKAANAELPASWSGYSQHSKDCLPLATEHETASTVLKFRDDAFHQYFENPDYLDFVEKKFGLETRIHIQEMSKVRLHRNILAGEHFYG